VCVGAGVWLLLLLLVRLSDRVLAHIVHAEVGRDAVNRHLVLGVAGGAHERDPTEGPEKEEEDHHRNPAVFRGGWGDPEDTQCGFLSAFICVHVCL
jgi:hypothetical protein